MDGSAPPSAVPDPDTLRPLLYAYFGDGEAETTLLREALCAIFCANAEAGVPVERALASVNAEIDSVVSMTLNAQEAVKVLKRLVMVCCLDCYYPHEPRRDRQRASA